MRWKPGPDGISVMLGSITAAVLLVTAIAFGVSEIWSIAVAAVAGGVTAMLPVHDLRKAVRERDWHSLAVEPGIGTGMSLAVVLMLGITVTRLVIRPVPVTPSPVTSLPAVSTHSVHPSSSPSNRVSVSTTHTVTVPAAQPALSSRTAPENITTIYQRGTHTSTASTAGARPPVAATSPTPEFSG